MLITFTGRSGAGKDYLAKLVCETLDIKMQVSTTSREIREGESRSAYNFVSRDAFEHMLSEGLFAEHVIFDNEYYGILKANIEYVNSVAIVEVDGLKQLKSIYGASNVFSVLVTAPDELVLERIKANPKRLARFESDKQVFDKSNLEGLYDMEFESIEGSDVKSLLLDINNLLMHNS